MNDNDQPEQLEPEPLLFVCAICGRVGELDGEDLVPVFSRIAYQRSHTSLDTRPCRRVVQIIKAGSAICAYHWPLCRCSGEQEDAYHWPLCRCPEEHKDIDHGASELRRRRRAAHVRSNDLARQIGISSSYLSDLELGRRKASLRTYIRWLLVLDQCS